ncbi:protein kinase domain-containing protein [Streptomyces sp. NPDC002073]
MGTLLHPDDPERLGGYWLAARLGAGSQGVVYEAYDRTGARVAVKALHRDAQQFVRDRFGKEVDAARAVAPFCTARILDAALDADTPYIVSEYIPGPTLAAAVREQGVLGAEAVTRLAAGIATALAAIHQAKVIHRDLKPGNVLLGPDGPRVIDFGIARASDMSVTATGAIMGTFGYMAPEVLGGQRATQASDIFAWGALVLYAASAEEPFRGDNIGQVAHRTAAVDPDLSALPAPLRPLVAAALAKEPALRPTATELLLGLVGDTPAAADPRRALLEAGARRAADPRPEAELPGLGERAEQAYASLPFGAQQAAHELLLRLVVPGDDPDGSQDTVRTAAYEELYGGRTDAERAEGHAAITALAAAGALIVAEDHSIRPVSAALIRAWTRLRAWTEADRGGLALRHRLGHAAREWQRHGRRPEDLQQGTALRAALDWSAAAAPHVRPNPLELAFLEAGKASATRTARRRRQLLGGLGVLLVASLVAGGLAYQQSRAAAREQARAAARTTAQAAVSLRAADPKLAMLLGVAAWDIAETEDSRAALLGAVNQREVDMLQLPAEAADHMDASYRALSANGRVFALGTGDQTQLWDVRAKRMLASTKGKPGMNGLSFHLFSPDGRLVLGVERGAFQVFETANLKPVGPRSAVPGDPSQVTNDGLVLSEESRGNGYSVPYEYRSHVVRASDGKQLVEGSWRESLVLSGDGRLAATCRAGGSVQLWRMGSGGLESAALARPRGDSQPECQGGFRDGMLFSPDGATLVASSGQKTFIWKTADGTHARTENESYGKPVFSSEGKYLLDLDTETGVLLVHGIAAGTTASFRYSVRAHGGNDHQTFLTYGLDDASGRLVFHRSETTTVESVDVPTPPPGAAGLLQGLTTDAWPKWALSDSGRVGAIPLEEGARRLFDVRSGKPMGPPLKRSSTGMDAGASLGPDGRRLAAVDGDYLAVWDTTTGREIVRKNFAAPESSSGHAVGPLALSPDGRKFALFYGSEPNLGNAVSITHPGAVQVWDVDSGKKLHSIETIKSDFAFRPDGSLLVSGAGDVLDLRTGKHRRNAFGPGLAGDVTFSPDGKILAVAKENGLIELWDGELAGKPVVLASEAIAKGGDRYGEPAGNLVISPDGRFLAALIGVDSVQFWDLESRLALGRPLPLATASVQGLAFDGNVLRILDEQNPLRSLDTDPGKLIDAVCRRVAGRELTEDEWKQYVPRGIEYRKVCS